MKLLRITTHWSAEEAECVYQLLDEFKKALWQSYDEEKQFSLKNKPVMSLRILIMNRRFSC